MHSPDAAVPSLELAEQVRDIGRVHIFLIDGSPITQRGIHAIVESSDGLKIVGTAQDGDVDHNDVRRLAPDVIVINAVSLSEKFLVEVVELTERAAGFTMRILLIVNDHESAAARRVRAFADGIILIQASAEEFVAAVNLIAAGYSIAMPEQRRAEVEESSSQPGLKGRAVTALGDPATVLTRRELDVLRAAAKGYTNAEIARTLALSESTVKSHMQNLLAKLGQPNRVSAIVLAYEVGMLVDATSLAPRGDGHDPVSSSSPPGH